MNPEKSDLTSKSNQSVIDVSNSVAVSVEALALLRLDIAKDKMALTEVISKEYEQLITGQTKSGELFVQLQINNDYELRAMLDSIDNCKFNGYSYPKFYVWHKPPWTTGSKQENFILKNVIHHKPNVDLDKTSGSARLALNDGEDVLTPLIHFKDKPFDTEDVVIDEFSQTTQIEAFKEEKTKYQALNPDYI